ncbi:hypothetical protein V9T40_005992 [Parthenolecanium corni]|uniref:[histone H4]-lysine(20) N-methyltransferase n=1 Tax=Parthenolecanium corni TaxID=536013 RepID=A0AAN9YA38_9HEMI
MTSAAAKSKFPPFCNGQLSITNYYEVQKKNDSSENSPELGAMVGNVEYEPKNLILANNSNNLSESNERCENHHVIGGCSTSGDELHKTESSVPFSPSTATSKLSIGSSPKRPSKTKKCGNVLKTNNQTLNAKILQDSGNSCNSQTKLPEFFPVRRSVRKTEKTVLEEKRKTLEEAVLSNKEDGLEIRMFEGKGRGIVSTRKFYKGEFVVEYAGKLINMEEAQKLENKYAKDENVGCYMYYFKHRNQQYCIDATEEPKKPPRLGRLLNHSRFGNLNTKTIEIKGVPHLILIAKEDIEPGCELTYDYGDRSKRSLQYHPWLAH